MIEVILAKEQIAELLSKGSVLVASELSLDEYTWEQVLIELEPEELDEDIEIEYTETVKPRWPVIEPSGFKLVGV